MKNINLKHYKHLLFLLAGSLGLLPWISRAADLGFDDEPPIDTGVVAPLDELVIRIMDYLLGFLGLITLILIIYGGFRYMTAAGNEEQIESAKKLITAAIIGLIIILIAWPITIFVGRAILETP